MTIRKSVTDIRALDWYSAREEGCGDLYKGLLAKNADEKKSGAGQYFTPRPPTDAIVASMKPTGGRGPHSGPRCRDGQFPHCRAPLLAYSEDVLSGASGVSLRQMLRQAVNSTKPGYRA
ncbi:N-6 DNA methylase [Deinococcus hopiensis]|uniref:N-6 DNA methylase n=1 Tax=Deinococcus hopiensis TaxID=309885 RepID=UPI001BAF7FF4